MDRGLLERNREDGRKRGVSFVILKNTAGRDKTSGAKGGKLEIPEK